MHKFDISEFMLMLQSQQNKGDLRLVAEDDTVIIYDCLGNRLYSFYIEIPCKSIIDELNCIGNELSKAFPLYVFRSSLPYNIKVIVSKEEETRCRYNISAVVNMKLINFFSGRTELSRIPTFDIEVG